jgi:hypothetical protein
VKVDEPVLAIRISPGTFTITPPFVTEQVKATGSPGVTEAWSARSAADRIG